MVIPLTSNNEKNYVNMNAVAERRGGVTGGG